MSYYAIALHRIRRINILNYYRYSSYAFVGLPVCEISNRTLVHVRPCKKYDRVNAQGSNDASRMIRPNCGGRALETNTQTFIIASNSSMH